MQPEISIVCVEKSTANKQAYHMMNVSLVAAERISRCERNEFDLFGIFQNARKSDTHAPGKCFGNQHLTRLFHVFVRDSVSFSICVDLARLLHEMKLWSDTLMTMYDDRKREIAMKILCDY